MQTEEESNLQEFLEGAPFTPAPNRRVNPPPVASYTYHRLENKPSGEKYHALFMLCLASLRKFIRDGRTVSVRDLYYTHVNAFRHNPTLASKIISDITLLFREPRISFGIDGGSKGLVGGKLQVLVRDNNLSLGNFFMSDPKEDSPVSITGAWRMGGNG
eukprot:gb/GECG01011866.1/.p1 GENE.gb/GECG01011866.1/~~gb/GECG01011866.1/.p1  ORF type:complete len:159 (+),score=13.28 gb/GECG01011866.1/:1-477(+)